jgi:hypothetical protein
MGFGSSGRINGAKRSAPPTPFPGDADSTVIILQNATAKIPDPWEVDYKATDRLGQITAPFERRAPPIPIKALGGKPLNR